MLARFDLFADRNATSAVIGPLNDIKGKVMPLAGGRGVRQKCLGNVQIGVHDPGALDRPIHSMYGDEIQGRRQRRR